MHQRQVRAAAHPGHVCPEVAAGKLHCVCADRAGCAVDQDLLPRLNLTLLQTAPGGLARAGDRRGLLEGEIGRFERQHPVFGQAFVFGVAAEIDGEGGGEDRVAGLEAGHLLADRFDLPGQLHAQDVTPGSAPPQDQPRHDLLPARDGQVEAAHDRVANGDGRGIDFHQHFVVTRRRLGNIRQPQHFRRAVSGVNDGFHLNLPWCVIDCWREQAAHADLRFDIWHVGLAVA